MIHQHEPWFREIHTQIAGFGRMQKFEANRLARAQFLEAARYSEEGLVEEVYMAPGFTTFLLNLCTRSETPMTVIPRQLTPETLVIRPINTSLILAPVFGLRMRFHVEPSTIRLPLPLCVGVFADVNNSG